MKASNLDELFDNVKQLSHEIIDDILASQNKDKMELLTNILCKRKKSEQTQEHNFKGTPEYSTPKIEFINKILGGESTNIDIYSHVLTNNNVQLRNYMPDIDRKKLSKVELADTILYSIIYEFLGQEKIKLLGESVESLYDHHVSIKFDDSYSIKLTVKRLHRYSSQVNKYQSPEYLKSVIKCHGKELANDGLVEYEDLDNRIKQIEKNRWRIIEVLFLFEENKKLTLTSDKPYIPFEEITSCKNTQELRKAVMHMDAGYSFKCEGKSKDVDFICIGTQNKLAGEFRTFFEELEKKEEKKKATYKKKWQKVI